VFDGTNLGVGVTPSAWKSNYKASQVGNATAVVGRTDSNNNYFSSNWYVNSSNQDIYQNTGFATLYSQGTGTHAWYTAASGTAGNAITFTQALTLNANGALALQGGSTSANGVGITFPTTQSASSNANTLDDYEEGTWTPTLTNCGSATVSSANYIKVGNVVTITLIIAGGTFTSNSSRFTMPFSSIGISSGTFSIATTVGGFLEPQASTTCYFVTTASGNANCSVTYITS
jgi:hypothetical protein